MDKYFWIKDLVLAEQEMEEKGLVDFSVSPNLDRSLELQTIEFLRDIKAGFAEAANTYNSFKKDKSEHIKIYGVSRTLADFMLFRNGFKLIFSMNSPGAIQIYSSQLPSGFIPNQESENQNSAAPIRHIIKAKWGVFEELQWTFKSENVRIDTLVRYYVSLFIKCSN